jgi:hypothetical protein
VLCDYFRSLGESRAQELLVVEALQQLLSKDQVGVVFMLYMLLMLHCYNAVV